MSFSRPYISKTEFLDYLTCPGYAWQARYHPELLPAVADSTQRKLRDGARVEALARQLYPEGNWVGPGHSEARVQRTHALIEAGVSTIFQATAVAEMGMLAQADILQRCDGGWHLIEVKSSSATPANVSAVVRKHLNDVAFQYLAFRQAGIPIVRTSLLALNRSYRRNGSVNPAELFSAIDISEEVAQHATALHGTVQDACDVLLNSREPAVCACHRKTRANRCALFHHFHPDIPDTDTIYNIASIQRGQLLAALDRGILKIADWPDDLQLTSRQQRQVDVARSGVLAIDYDNLAEFLTTLQEPLWYLDYESFQNAIPPWDGYGPHQQIPFQYSLHRWAPGWPEPEHRGYLATDARIDPTAELLAHLASDLGPTGSVVVWNRNFEFSRNLEMAARFPQYAAFLHDVNARMVDLADPVKAGWWAHPAFQGSWSLKRVLPVVAPELNYKALRIGDGGTASEQWMQAVLDSDRQVADTERAAVLDALRIYCEQDTVAMHRIRMYLHGLLRTPTF